MRTLRIAHVITKLDVGGAQTVAIALAGRAVAEGHRVTMIAGTDPGTGGDLRQRARDAGLDVVDVPSLRHRIRPGDELRAVLALRALLRQRFDVVHTHSSKAGLLGRFAAASVRVPVIVHHVHGWSFRPYHPAAVWVTYLLLERLAGSVTDRVICVSDADLLEGERRHVVVPGRSFLLPTPVDLHRFHIERSGDLRSLPRVVTVTRLGPPKDTETLVRAISGMATDVELQIVGDGPERPRLEMLADQLGVAHRIAFLGVRDDVPSLLASADLFVLSSRSEGMPTAVVEAMAAGVPVIASDVGGVSQLLEGGAGRMVAPGDPRALAGALDELVSDRSSAGAMSVAGSAVAAHHDLESAGRRVIALYRDVLDQKQPCASSS